MASYRNLALVALFAGCKQQPSKLDRLAAPPVADEVPLAGMPIVADGEWKEPAWNLRAMRGVLVTDGGIEARPYSEIRLLHDATTLYVALYAADEDIRSTDAWDLTLGARTLHVPATARVPGIAAGVDRDGTLDDPSDDDEEWVIELAVPLAELGPPPIAITASRCDRPRMSGEARPAPDRARMSGEAGPAPSQAEWCGTWNRTVTLQ